MKFVRDQTLGVIGDSIFNRKVMGVKYQSAPLTKTDVTYSSMKAVCEEIHELTKLSFGWDGFRGVPVSASTAEFATKLVARIMSQNSTLPSVGVGSGGSISLEWTNDEDELEIEITSTREIQVSRICLKTDEEEYHKNVNDNILTDWIGEFDEKNLINSPETHIVQTSKPNKVVSKRWDQNYGTDEVQKIFDLVPPGSIAIAY